MSLETQFRRTLMSVALVAGCVGLIVSQSEATVVEPADAQSLMAACEAPAVEVGGSSSEEASDAARTSWRTLLPSVFVRTRNK